MEAHLPQPAARQPLQMGESVTKNWTRINEQDVDLQQVLAQLAQLRRDLGTKFPTRKTFGHFPFRIYRLPDHYRSSPDPDTDWLKFRVRGGKVWIDWVEYDATGTDGAADPDDDTILDAGDVAVTSGVARYWFWLDISSGSVAVNHGASAPTWSPAHVPIGYVDTTNTTAQIAIVRQIVRTDLFTCTTI